MKPRTVGKAFSFWIAGVLALVALAAPAAPVAAQSTGTVTAFVRYCSGLSYQGLMGSVGPDCSPGGATFTFYLHGDGTDDSWTLAVGSSGEASMALPAGAYDVWTSGGPIFNVNVPAGGATSFTYGFPAAEPAPPPPPPPAPAPVAETATLNVNTYACSGVTGAPIVLTSIGPDCTRIATNLDFYLYGDGTDRSWNLSTSAAGAVSIVLPVGDYEVLNTYSWARVGATVPSGGGTLSIGYAAPSAPVPPPPPPAPAMGAVEVSVFHCTGLQSPGILNEVGSDCVPGPAVFDFYLIGDGTDDSWRLNVGASGEGSRTLAAGEYEVYEVTTDTRVPNVVIPANGTDGFVFGIPRVVAPPAQTGVLTVNTYSCTGVTGGAIILNEIGPDCRRVSATLDLYLWGDGTDDSWRVTTSAAGPVNVTLPVGDYQVIDNPTWLRVNVTVPQNGTTLSIGFPASAGHGDMAATP